jgi:hypothetical protein
VSENINELLASKEELFELSVEDALERIGVLTDLLFDAREIEPLRYLIGLSKSFKKEKELSEKQLVVLNYFIANMWSNIRVLSKDESEQWEWEQEEIEKEIIFLRRAMDRKGFDKTHEFRQCQILTNLGNNFSHVGRFVGALEYWNKALEINNSFAMAIGNKGYGLIKYAQSLYDDGHATVFFQYAYTQLKKAIESQDIHENAKKGFQKSINWLESILSEECLKEEFELEDYSLGDSEEEINYREWCLEKRLFLNPLNDLGAFSIAGQDILNLPNIVTGIDEGPYYLGFFNQMKQEYVSARYLYYEGIKAEETHFSDKDVFLYDTLDYPEYSIGVEKIKAAYRMVYSLFDKIAYFLTEYFDLDIKTKVYFRNLWYWNEDYNNDLKEEFKKKTNWPLRGLFWLSKDLLSEEGFEEAIDPEARKIATIRNHLEHKYLKMHVELWRGETSKEKDYSLNLKDSLAYSLYRKVFESKTLKLIKLARAALIYLSLAVHREEQVRGEERDNDEIVAPAFLDEFDDKWKV